MLSLATAFFLVSVAGVVICLCFFCCEDDDGYNNSSTSPPLPTTTTWLLYQSPPPNTYSRGEVTTTTTTNYGNGTHRTGLTSHHVGETGQIPSTCICVSTATKADFTNDVHRPRLASPLSEASSLTGPLPFRPPTHYSIHCSSSGHLGANSSPRLVPNSRSPDPVLHVQYGVKAEASENAQEMGPARVLREQARRAVPNPSSPNPVSHVGFGVEVESSEMKTARWLREQAQRVVPNSSTSSLDPVPRSWDGVEVEVSENALETVRELREQARQVVPNSSSLNPVPHDQFGVEVESSEMRTARWLREQAQRVVPNSSSNSLDPVPRAWYGAEVEVEVEVSANPLETARKLREQARRVVPNSSSLNPVPHDQFGVEVEASEIRTARWLREQARQVVPNSRSPSPVPHARCGVEVETFANGQEMKPARDLRKQARRVVPNSSSPNPAPHVRFNLEVEASENVQEMKIARELREQARRIKREMYAAQKLAKNAGKNGDYRAEQRYRQVAMVHESQVKVLDDRAAEVIFRDNNKVRVHLSRCQGHTQPRLCQTLQEGMVDLHGLYVPEAIEYAKKEIESATCRRDDEIYFTVGTSYNEACGVYARTLYIGSTPRQRATRRQGAVEASASSSRTLRCVRREST